jgi:hypothetical protein
LNIAVVLPVLAGAAIAMQTVLNSLGMRFLGLGGLIGFSGLVTSLLRFAAAAVLLARPEITGRAIRFVRKDLSTIKIVVNVYSDAALLPND